MYRQCKLSLSLQLDDHKLRLHGFGHLCFQNPCNFHTLDCFHCSWQAVVITYGNQFHQVLIQGIYKNGWGLFYRHAKIYCDSVYTLYV